MDKDIANILKNCHIDRFMDIHDNQNVYISNQVETPAAPPLSPEQRLLKTFFSDDNFFEKTIAAAPTCTTTDLVVMKIYRMLRVDAEMDDALLRSKPFLEALIGVLPEYPAFSVGNLQSAIRKKKI